MGLDLGALSYLLSSSNISIPKTCFSQGKTKPNCIEKKKKGNRKKIDLEVGVRRRVMCRIREQ